MLEWFVPNKSLVKEKDIVCSYCDERIVLYDLIEKKFNRDEFLRKVQELDARANINLYGRDYLIQQNWVNVEKGKGYCALSHP